MHKDKFEIFKGLRKRKRTPEEIALKEQGEKIKHQAALIKGLMEHDGWKLLEDFFKKKKTVLAHELKICSPDELIRLQEKSKIIDEFESFLYSKLLRDPDL